MNTLTSDYDLKLALMERRVSEYEIAQTIEEIKVELSLCKL
jgi:hypothetical protein